MKLSEKLRHLRNERGLTLDQVSQLSGIPRRTYVSYEQEGRYPRKNEVYEKLAKVLGCDVTYLVGGDEAFVVQAAEHFGGRGKRQAEELVAELSGMFAGGELSDSDMDAVMIALQKAYFDCKKDNVKYTPHKYRKEKSTD